MRVAAQLADELRKVGGCGPSVGPCETQLLHQYELLNMRAELKAKLQPRGQEVRAGLPGVSDLFEDALRLHGLGWPDLLARLRLDKWQADRFVSRRATLLAVDARCLALAARDLGISAEALTLAAAKELWPETAGRALAFRSLKGQEGPLPKEPKDASREKYLTSLWLVFREEPGK